MTGSPAQDVSPRFCLLGPNGEILFARFNGSIQRFVAGSRVLPDAATLVAEGWRIATNLARQGAGGPAHAE